MNGFTNSILSLLLSWIRLLIGQIWAALNSENGSRALSFLQSNWKFLVGCLAVGGFVADRLVYFLRWRPDIVWRNRRKARRSQRRQDFSHEYVPTVENPQPVSPAQWEEPLPEEEPTMVYRGGNPSYVASGYLPREEHRAVQDEHWQQTPSAPAQPQQATWAVPNESAGFDPVFDEDLGGWEHGDTLVRPDTIQQAAQGMEQTFGAAQPEPLNYIRDMQAGFARPLPPEEIPPCGEVVLAAEDVWFKYEEKGPDVVRGLHMTVRQGEFVALLGGNGTGKSTTLRLLSEGLRPYRGTVRHTGRLGVLPQNPQALFVKKTVREDLFETFDGLRLPPAEQQRRVEQMVTLCRLTELLDRHPYDLSGGEQQRAALAKVMLLEPDILLMDEPTKGLDAEFKQSFAAMVRSLLSGGVTVLMVSHDVEFCARYAHRCALFFDGSISAEGTPRAFFGGNSFYTTSADRMARGLLPHAVTAEDVMAGIGGTVPPEPEVQHTYAPLPPAAEESADWKPPKLPWWRRGLAAVSGAVALVILWMATRKTDLTALVGGGKVSAAGWQTLATYGIFLAAMFVLVASIGRRAPPPVQVQTPVEKRKLSRRTVVASVLILLMIPVTLVVCVGLFGRTHYYITALLVMLECMLPFFMVFEGRRPQARELTIIAVLCALGVAGRSAFFMLPQFKPVMALTIIAGVAFGGETGFLVGAMTMLASNVLFSQGPWCSAASSPSSSTGPS